MLPAELLSPSSWLELLEHPKSASGMGRCGVKRSGKGKVCVWGGRQAVAVCEVRNPLFLSQPFPSKCKRQALSLRGRKMMTDVVITEEHCPLKLSWELFFFFSSSREVLSPQHAGRCVLEGEQRVPLPRQCF